MQGCVATELLLTSWFCLNVFVSYGSSVSCCLMAPAIYVHVQKQTVSAGRQPRATQPLILIPCNLMCTVSVFLGLIFLTNIQNALCRWHAEHQELYVRKRIALADWRNQKEAQKAALAVQASFEAPSARQALQQRHLHQEQARMSRLSAYLHCFCFEGVVLLNLCLEYLVGIIAHVTL